MEGLRRVLVAFWGLVLGGVSVLIAVGLVNHEFAVNAMDFIQRCIVYNLRLCFIEGRMLWAAIGIGALLVILALLSLIVAFKGKKMPRNVHVSDHNGNNVDISLDAVDSVIKRAAASVAEARNILTKLEIKRDGLYINLMLAVPQGVSIPETGAQVRQEVAEQLAAMVGINPQEIRVEISHVLDKPEEVSISGIR